ncbi:MAG: DUF2970 domain-containing protein [Porticoccaceae bacterium]|jgi:hypothetical protein|nr:DUF2970 domain-containing protein [Porticoccaceae bacterium]
MTDKNQESKPGFAAIVKSTMAAALGVQSSKNRERDFKHGNIKTFIVAGIIFTIIFIATIITVVKLVLKNAGV